MEVTQHSVALPATKESNSVGVDIGIEKRHRAAGSEGAGADVGGGVAILGAKGSRRLLEDGGDGRGGNQAETLLNVVRG